MSLQPYHTFSIDIQERMSANDNIKRQHFIDSRKFSPIFDLAIKDISLPPPNETKEQARQRLNEEHKYSLLRYMLAKYELPLPFIKTIKEQKALNVDPLEYLKKKYGAVMIKFIDSYIKTNKEPWMKDEWIKWLNMATAVYRYNKNLLTVNLSYISAEDGTDRPTQAEIDAYLSRVVPLTIYDLSITEQVYARKNFTFAWLERDFPKEWILQNNQNISYAQKMYGGGMKENYINGTTSTVTGLNKILEIGNWSKASLYHKRQYEQLMFALDHNPITVAPLILFEKFDSDNTPNVGDKIVEYGFNSRFYIYEFAAQGSISTFPYTDKVLIISYPVGHKLIMKNEKLEFLTYPGEILQVDHINDNDIYCHFAGYQNHIDSDGAQIIVPRQIEYSIIDESPVYAYEELYFYLYQNNDSWSYNQIRKFLEKADVITLPIRYDQLDEVKPDIINELNKFLQTGQLPILDSLRQGHPELKYYIHYFTKNIVTVTPIEAANFYEIGHRSLQDVMNDDELVLDKFKIAIYWRAHLTQPIYQEDIDDVAVAMRVAPSLGSTSLVPPAERVGLRPKWRQNYPVISVSTSDIAAVKAKLGSMIKAELEPNLIVVQTSPDKIAHLVELEEH